jgi:tetratricopeptide (TPR) repeat protein
MKMMSVLRCSLVLMAVSAIGCNNFETGDNTTTGAAAGGVVGAGLGAVVGNQVGNTAEGVAIGAIAGAGTGAAFGSVFDRQQATMRGQDEAIERQERVILSQQNELKELRKLGQDSVSFKEPSYSNAPVVSSKEFSFPSTPPVRVANNSMGHSRSTAAAPTAAMPISQGAVPAPAFPTAPRNPTATDSYQATGTYQKSTAPVQERSLPIANNTAPAQAASMQKGNEGVVRGSYGWNNTQPKPATRQPEPLTQQVPPPPVSPTQVAPAIVDRGMPAAPPQAQALALNTPECQKAENEAKSALTARDAADKLFHYRRALRLCPDNASYHNGLGEVYITLNRNEDARYEFQEALRLSPGHAGAQANLTRVP